ncbi:MAG: dTDP-glucose 4,6-dehydratase [Candidatus Aureabacteria bacterium]|nr:dTDP-glucose 4,6-dehydratase [Candidatus Auribacterota bacterium]
MKLLVTGGAGFIGSNFIRYYLSKHRDCSIVNLDKLTYAGNLDNLKDIQSDPRYRFIKGDIADASLVRRIVGEGIEVIANFAAETHVDRAIGHAGDFIRTDVYGAFVLLESARAHKIKKFIQISTDEVYGSIEKGSFKETDPLMPRNPYAASKAGADRLAYSYWATYQLPVVITRASNNFGPYQYPEKVIPLFVTNALRDIPVPLYGDGMNVRDWLFVEDHCAAVALLIEAGTDGEVYNVGGGNEIPNVELTHFILDCLKKPRTLIKQVKDRQGHDRRYSLNCDKVKKLGWRPRGDFKKAMGETVDWYARNEWWWDKLKSGEYWEYYRKQYVEREQA